MDHGNCCFFFKYGQNPVPVQKFTAKPSKWANIPTIPNSGAGWVSNRCSISHRSTTINRYTAGAAGFIASNQAAWKQITSQLSIEASARGGMLVIHPCRTSIGHSVTTVSVAPRSASAFTRFSALSGITIPRLGSGPYHQVCC